MHLLGVFESQSKARVLEVGKVDVWLGCGSDTGFGDIYEFIMAKMLKEIMVEEPPKNYPFFFFW